MCIIQFFMDRLMVGQRPLTSLTVVRVHVPEPNHILLMGVKSVLTPSFRHHARLAKRPGSGLQPRRDRFDSGTVLHFGPVAQG